MHLSREAIQNHLVTLAPENNLFNRIALLKLPTIIQDYLLYGMYLEIDEDAKDFREDERQVAEDTEELSTIMYIGANDDDESEDEDINNGSVSGNAHGLLPFFIGNGLG